MSPKSLASPISDSILARIGFIASSWSALEAQLEFAILRHQEIDLGPGMLLTANLGYRSKVDLLTTFANEGGITPETEAKALLKLLGRANAAYGTQFDKTQLSTPRGALHFNDHFGQIDAVRLISRSVGSGFHSATSCLLMALPGNYGDVHLDKA